MRMCNKYWSVCGRVALFGLVLSTMIAVVAAPPISKPHLVLAHYMPCFPPAGISDNDYWYGARMDPKTDNLTARPALVARGAIDDINAYIDEVRLAKAYGLDGFLVDELEDNDAYFHAWTSLLKAAEIVGGFYIGVMPDHACLGDVTEVTRNPDHKVFQDKVLHWLQAGKDSPALLRYDGKPVVFTYGGGYPDSNGAPQGLKKLVVDWMADHGTPIAFGATLGCDWPVYKFPYANDPQTGYQTMSFATGTFSPLKGMTKLREQALNYWPKDFMQMGENAFALYDSKAGGYPRYDAPEMSKTYRDYWEWNITHRDQIKWVMLITWNDWGETAIAPSNNHSMAWAPVTRYYAEWFKTGKAPKITRDVVAIFHRAHPYGAKLRLAQQTVAGEKARKGFGILNTPEDSVEAVAFLKAPATLVLDTGGKMTRSKVKAGVHSLVAPFALGVQRAYIERHGKIVATVTSPVPVHDQPARENLWFIAADSAHPPCDVTPTTWTTQTGSWQQTGKALRGTGMAVAGAGATLGDISIATTAAAGCRMAGVAARVRKDHDYRFTVTRSGDQLTWTLGRNDARQMTIFENGQLTLAADKPVRLMLSCVGEYLIGYINDALVSSNMADWAMDHGQVGLLAGEDTTTFQDVSVVSYDSALPPLPPKK